MPKGDGRGGKRTPGDGKKLGRPAKAKIELSADKGTASTVLASLPELEVWRFLAHAEAFDDLRSGHKLTKEQVEACKKSRDQLGIRDREQIQDAMEYLTNRRDGKPAQGVFHGDTREGAEPLSRGSNAPSYFGSAAHTTRNAAGSDKPN